MSTPTREEARRAVEYMRRESRATDPRALLSNLEVVLAAAAAWAEQRPATVTELEREIFAALQAAEDEHEFGATMYRLAERRLGVEGE